MNAKILRYVIGKSITPQVNHLIYTILTSKSQRYPLKHLEARAVQDAERLGLIVTDGTTASLTELAALFLFDLFSVAKNEGEIQ
jgi:hypothetical protein